MASDRAAAVYAALTPDAQRRTSPENNFRAFVEVKNHAPKTQTPFGFVFSYDHKWGKNNWKLWEPKQAFSAQTGVFHAYLQDEPFNKLFDDTTFASFSRCATP